MDAQIKELYKALQVVCNKHLTIRKQGAKLVDLEAFDKEAESIVDAARETASLFDGTWWDYKACYALYRNTWLTLLWADCMYPGACDKYGIDEYVFWNPLGIANYGRI